MKKLLCLMLFGLLLCGCGQEPVNEIVGFDGAATFPTEAVEEFPLLDLGEANAVTRGQIGDYVTPIGRFYITVDGEEVYSNSRDDPKPFLLTFDDYETGQTYPLCTRPQCLHSDASCSAFFPLVTGQPEYFYYDGEYLYFYLGGEEALYRQRIDGTEREKLFELSGYSIDILYEGRSAYCLGMTMEQDDSGQLTVRRILQKLDLETGQQTDLPFSFEGALAEVSLLDKFGGELILRYTYSLDTVTPFRDAARTHHMLFLLNIETGEITRLLDGLSTWSATASCPGYRICAVFDEGSQRDLKLRGGEWPVFSGDVYIFDLQNRICYCLADESCLSWEYSIWDGKLFYYDLSSDGTALEPKIRDLETGEVTPWYFGDGEPELNQIAETPDSFIVRTADGAACRISKEDYYAGIPNLESLTD